jgi:hypothetical protein
MVEEKPNRENYTKCIASMVEFFKSASARISILQIIITVNKIIITVSINNEFD